MAAGDGPMNDEAGVGAGRGEVGVLRQEAVARMHRVGTQLSGGRDDGRDVEIARARLRRPDAGGDVGAAHVQRIRVGLGVHRRRAVAHRLGRAHDPAGDLAAIGDQDGAESCHAGACPRHPAHPQAREHVARWIPATSAGMTALAMRVQGPAITGARSSSATPGLRFSMKARMPSRGIAGERRREHVRSGIERGTQRLAQGGAHQPLGLAPRLRAQQRRHWLMAAAPLSISSPWLSASSCTRPMRWASSRIEPQPVGRHAAAPGV